MIGIKKYFWIFLIINFKIQVIYFSFSTEWGQQVKKWLIQIYITYIFLWGIWIISLFFYFHTFLLFQIYAYDKLQKSVNLPLNFYSLYKINLFYIALEFTLNFLIVFFLLGIIAFFLTHEAVLSILFRYTWLILFFIFLFLLFVNWYCFITESALYSFRNNKVTTQQILKILLEASQFRYNNYLKTVFGNINLIISGFLLWFGFIYLWIRSYFSCYDNYWDNFS
jgi:hypothetical protein